MNVDDNLEKRIEDVWHITGINRWNASSADQEHLRNYSEHEDSRAVWLCKVDRTEALIKQNLATALISTSGYVRRYAELLESEK
jgi:hypothetical protein